MRFRPLFLLALSVLMAGSAYPGSDAGSSYSRWPKVRIAGFSVGAGYTHLGNYSPYFGSPFGYPFGYSPFYAGAWGFPFYGSLLSPATFYPDTLGKVKLDVADRNASIYLDGGFAGTSGKLKTMWIEPGTHDLRVTSGDRTFEQRIYVLTGRTLSLNPQLLSPGSRP